MVEHYRWDTDATENQPWIATRGCGEGRGNGFTFYVTEIASAEGFPATGLNDQSHATYATTQAKVRLAGAIGPTFTLNRRS